MDNVGRLSTVLKVVGKLTLNDWIVLAGLAPSGACLACYLTVEWLWLGVVNTVFRLSVSVSICFSGFFFISGFPVLSVFFLFLSPVSSGILF